MNKDLEQAKALLENNEEYTCAACRAGESFASEEHGVRPLMRWLNEGTDLSGASAADRIVGKAAAFLYVLLGVRTVYAPLMSVPARETLCAHGIEAIADAVVPAIRNRTDTGFCPMESAVWDISDPHEAKAAENMGKLWFAFILAYVLASSDKLAIVWQMLAANAGTH